MPLALQRLSEIRGAKPAALGCCAALGQAGGITE